LRLKKLITLEIAFVVVMLVVVLIGVQFTPSLVSQNRDDKINVFSQKEYSQNTVSLFGSEKTSCRFNYSTFDPAILVIDLTFHSWQNPGYLSLYCNDILVVTIEATPRNPNVQLTTVTVSGYDLIKPHQQLSYIFNNYVFENEISFVSTIENGYEGIFSYKVSIRGSR
jgi:hypothetical protein